MKKLWKHYVAILALMAGTSLALAYTVDVRLADQPGVLMELPSSLGAWQGDVLKYCHNPDCEKTQFHLSELDNGGTVCPACGEPLHNMSVEEYDALPKDTRFIKAIYTNPDGRELFVSVVLSGRERSSIHRPQRCLVGQGYTIEDTNQRSLDLGNGEKLDVTVLESALSYRGPMGPEVYHAFYAYWFVGQGRETPSHYARMFWLAWDRVVHGVAHKWAYVAVSGARDERSDAYLDEIGGFVSKLHEAIVL